MAEIIFEEVSKTYVGGARAVDDINLHIKNGELMVLVGPSGCGKSTLMRMVAGLEEISEGRIIIGGKVVNRIPPQQRNVAMVFQNYALYPHMTVRGNLEFPLRMQKLTRAEINRRVQRTAETLDLTALLDRRPKALSGGQRQRVAMGRAIIRDAEVFLMDEPLSNLDAKLRLRIRTEIAVLQARLGITTLYVTHDQVEAMTLGQRVAVMRGGRLQQVASPRELYERPANIFVAGFFGSPGMNVLRVTLQSTENGLAIRLGKHSLFLPVQFGADYAKLGAWVGREVLVGIRPAAITLAEPGTPGSLPVTVRAAEYLGHETILHGDADVVTVTADSGQPDAMTEKAAVLTAVLSGYHPLQSGELLRVQFDTENLRFFDLNGKAIDLTTG